MPVTGTAHKVPAASSAATAKELSTAGQAPAVTAALIAVVEDSSAAGGTCSRPAWTRRASARKSRVPEPASRLTRGVWASSVAGTPLRRRAHPWVGATTRVSTSRPTGSACRPGGMPGPSTKPMSARSPRTSSATSAELTADSATAAPGWTVCRAVSHAGTRYSATVMLAAICSRESRSRRRAVTPASRALAASTAACAQSATSTPDAVSLEPRGERSISARPSCPSSSRIRALAAGWEMPCSAAARPRLPTRATLSSRSKPVRSDTLDGRGIDRGYDLTADWSLPRSAAGADPGIVTQILDMPRTGPGLVPQPPRSLPLGLLKELDHPQDMFRDLGPNWYASVMGTGIVAIAGAKLPVYVPGLHEFATAVWILAAAALVALT